MKVVSCYKLSPDNQVIECRPDGRLAMDGAEWRVGEYDFVAIEVASRIGANFGAQHIGLSVGPKALEVKKEQKTVLSRGVDYLSLVIDDRLDRIDTHNTARVLKAAVEKIGDVDLVVCGEGSADNYYRQTGIQLGELLGWPSINAVSSIEDIADGFITLKRTTEKDVQTLKVKLPAVISVTSNHCVPRIPSMKDILGAGKKPVNTIALDELSEIEPTINIVSTRKPKAGERKKIIIKGTTEEVVDKFVEHLKIDGLV